MADFTLVTEHADIALLMSTFQPLKEGERWVLPDTAAVSLVTTIWDRELKFEIWGFYTEPKLDLIEQLTACRNLFHIAVHGTVNYNDFDALVHRLGDKERAEQFLIDRESRRRHFIPAPTR